MAESRMPAWRRGESSLIAGKRDAALRCLRSPPTRLRAGPTRPASLCPSALAAPAPPGSCHSRPPPVVAASTAVLFRDLVPRGPNSCLIFPTWPRYVSVAPPRGVPGPSTPPDLLLARMARCHPGPSFAPTPSLPTWSVVTCVQRRVRFFLLPVHLNLQTLPHCPQFHVHCL